MKKCLVVIAALFVAATGSFGQQRLVDYVNPFIGTGGHGHTYPGATLPFGMVQVGPDNGTQGWDWSSGYHYSDSIISGFSHTHLSGTGIGDLADISVLPVVGAPDTNKVYSTFSHKQERASPGFYGVQLRDFKVYAEMTSSLRCGFHRYAFPASDQSAIRLNLGFAINWDKTTDAHFKKIDDTTFVGYRFSTGWAKNQKVFYAIRLNKRVKSTTIFVNKKETTKTDVTADDIIAYLNFDTKAGEAIMMKVGISFADIEGALEGLNEIRTWNFTQVRRGAADLWERELRKVQINADKKTKEIFYTALYHTYLAPTIFSDRYGNYKGAKGDIRNGKMVLSTHSLWDTFRAANPLLTITQTEMIGPLINSYLAFYDQYGYLPVWDLHFNETNTMTGYHAIPVIADAIMKNLRGFDYEKAYTAMKRSAAQNIRGTERYRNFGFVPADKMKESVTVTLEYAFDDWCIAQVARKLKKYSDTAQFNKRAGFWKNLFDDKTGFFRGKDMYGKWVEPFDPLAAHAEGANHPYTEGNAWQHSFFVPHDVEGLRQAFPKENGLEDKLDSLFGMSSQITGNPPPDITGLIGQYAHGNEPSHHIAYMYNYIQRPWKTQERVRDIMKLYDNTPAGLPGNEDCGQMSAWYVFSSLGFYPVNPASGQYVFGSPLVNEAILLLPSGMTFKMVVENNGPVNKYIQSITLNGKPYTKNYITHHNIMIGGMLVIKMGPEPNKKFGIEIDDLPRSVTEPKVPEVK